MSQRNPDDYEVGYKKPPKAISSSTNILIRAILYQNLP